MLPLSTRHCADLRKSPLALISATIEAISVIRLRRIGSQIVVGGLAIALTITAGATSAKAEDEPSPKRQQTHSRGGGSRGCSRLVDDPLFPSKDASTETKPLLVLLTTPDGQVRTRSPRPSFAWYVREPSARPLEFRIYRQRRPSEVETDAAAEDAELVLELMSDSFVSRPGIMTITLPKSAPSLSPGETYWWQVEMQCDPQDPSSNLFAEATLEIVPFSEPSQWYDELESLLKAEAQRQIQEDGERQDFSSTISASLAELLRAEMGISEAVLTELSQSSVYAISSQAWAASQP